MNTSEARPLFYHCDSQGFEYPSDFDMERSKAMVVNLVRMLARLLPGEVEGVNLSEAQDCTFFARLPLPREICVSGFQINLYISNFGDMAAVQNEDYVLPQYLEAIRNAVGQHGFQWINESELLKDYDGQWPAFEKWWGRFFDYW